MDEVLFEKKSSVAKITINRESRRNSIVPAVINTLRAYISRANHDPDIHSVVLTGAGNNIFCAGGDLGKDAKDEDAISHYDANKSLIELFKDIRLLKKPLIARVNGHALGMGFAILLASDLVVAVEKARFACPEQKVGLFPMMITTHLKRHLGPKRAFEMMLTSQQISAIEAEQLGLINYAVKQDELDNKIDELTNKISEFSPLSIKLGKDAFYQSESMDFDSAASYLLSQFTLNQQSQDAKEGKKAFLQKRKPKWSGR